MKRKSVGVALVGSVVAFTGVLLGFSTVSASASPLDIRGAWAEIGLVGGTQYPQTVTFTTENFSTGAVTGNDVGGGATFTVTGKLSGTTLTTDTVEVGASYTSHAVGTIKNDGGKLVWSGTFTDSAGHQGGTFTATFGGPGGGGAAASSSPAASGLGPVPPACTAAISTNCTYDSRDGALTFTPAVVKVGGTIVAQMIAPAGAGVSGWSWTDLQGLTAQNCAPHAVTCNYLATAVTGTPGARYVIGTIDGGSVQGGWTSAQAYAVEDAADAKSGSAKFLDVRGLWDGYYVAPGGAKYHNPVVIVTENFSTGALSGTDNGTDGKSSVSGSIAGRTVSLTIVQPPSFSQLVVWVISADGKRFVANNITDPTAPGAFVLYKSGAPVGASSPVTSGSGVTSGPAPINALPTPGEAFSSPGRIIASAAISIAALLFITFPANLFNKTFEENYDVIAAWWEPRLRRFRRKTQPSDAAAAAAGAGAEGEAAKRERRTFITVAVAGAVLGGFLNPKFGFNSASANGFVATLLSITIGTVIGASVGFFYRRAKHYDVTRHFQALPAGLVIALLCVVLSRISSFQPGYLYGVVCGVAFAGALAKNESGHMVALSHLATITVAVIAWFAWVPVNHAAMQHHGVFPLVILDDLLASLFVGGLVGSVVNLIPVRFMPGHALASWHRGAWMAVFGIAAFGMTEIVLFPSRHNHAGHAPVFTIIALFVVFGGGSLVFREYFSRRAKRLEATEPAAAEAATTETSTLGTDAIPAPRTESALPAPAEPAPAEQVSQPAEPSA